MGSTRHRGAAGMTVLAATAVAMQLAGFHARAFAAPPAAAQSERSAAKPQSRSPAKIEADAWLARLKSREMKAEPSGQDLFAGASWQPPPRPVTAAPSAPQTPPFPFYVLGQVSVGGNVTLALGKDDRTYAVKEGDVIEQFRVDRIGADRLVATYAPTKMTREYRYEQLAPPVSLRSSPVAGTQPTPRSAPPVQAPAVAGPAVAPAGLPAAEQGQAAKPDPNAMVPMGGIVVSPGAPTPAPGSDLVTTPLRRAPQQ